MMARPVRSRGTVRIDHALVDRGLIESRSRARALILAGRVRSAGTVVDKPGHRIAEDAPLEVDDGPRDVGRGAAKLRGALPRLAVGLADRVVLDVGASTGGFTQVALEAGARAVLAVDVGRGQLDWGLRNDPRVHPVEGINARHLRPADLPLAPEVALVDVSFISLRLVLPAIGECLPDGAEIVMLVKPQFEVGRRAVGKGGIVREPDSHREAVARIAAFAVDLGWRVAAVVPSPVAGTKGNLEFFLHVARRAVGPPGDGSWPDLVDGAVEEAHRQGAEP